MSADLSQTALEALRKRITRIIPNQIRSCIDQLSDEQLWWRPNEQANSVGNLVLHLSGSVRHYLGNQVGGIAYTRNRDAEFAERGPVERSQLLATWDDTVSQVTEVLAVFDTGRFLDPTAETDYVPTVFDLIYNVSIHMATHAGQIVWVTKMLEQGSIDELWIKAHRNQEIGQA